MMDNFLFGSARVSALANSLIGKDQLERLLTAQDAARCAELLAETGVLLVTDPETGTFLREETFQSLLRTSFREVEEATGNAAFSRAFRRQYDCNNVKAAIKCFKRGIDPAGMLFDFGNLDLGIILHAARLNDFAPLGELFASAAAEAVETFAKTGNPQWVDLILDRACFAAMLGDAKESRNDFLTDLVIRKIDLTNLLICFRLMRMKNGEAGRLLLADAFIPGGTFDAEFFEQAYAGSEEQLWKKLFYSELDGFAERVPKGAETPLSAIERAADDFWMSLVQRAKLIPYGVEPMTAYLVAVETEVRNLRIIFAGLEAGLPAKTIRERIRMSYV